MKARIHMISTLDGDDFHVDVENGDIREANKIAEQYYAVVTEIDERNDGEDE